MNPQKKLNRRIFLSSLMLIIFCIAFSSQSTQSIQNPTFYGDTPLEPKSSAFEGTGRQFELSQHANVTSSTYAVYPTTSTSFTLTNGWTADNILIEAENVTRHQNAVVDGTVQNVPSTYTYWDYNEYDTSGSNSLNPDYRYGMLSLDVGEYGPTVTGNWAYFNQVVTMNDDDVSDRMVEFSFDYRVRSNGVNYWGTSIYAAVIVGGVEYSYNIGFGSQSYDVFHTVSLQYYLSDEGQSVPNDIEFRFGVYVNTGQSHQGYYSDKHDVHFQNLEYNIWTLVDQTGFLVAEDNDDYTDYYYQNSAPGMGYFTIPVQKYYSTTQDVRFTITDSVSDTVLIDKLTISADLNKSIYSTFSGFQDGAFPGSDDILWTFTASPSIPVTYSNRYVEVQKPDDWEIISILDPFLTNRTTSCIDLEQGTTNFTIPNSVFSNGDWEFRARSKSWFDSATLEFWNGTAFVEKTDFYVGEEFQIHVELNDTLDFANTDLNFTIYHPNGTVVETLSSSEEPSTFEYYFGNFTIGSSNMSVGTYTAEVAWTNNRSANYVDKVGYKTFEFNVIHHTSFTAVETEIETVPGEALLILVQYTDTDLNLGIDLATVQYNTTFDEMGSLPYAGGGYYFLDLDTSDLDYTDYYLSFNASKPFYDNHTESDLILLSIQREGMILDVPRQVNSVPANSYALFEFNLTGEISEAYLSPANITTDWEGWHNITSYDNGTYLLNISTYGVISGSFPETYVITITANKTNYSETMDIVLLQIFPIATDIGVSESFIQVSQGDTFNVTLDYTETVGGMRVTNSLCDITWEKSYSISNTTNGFEIEFSTAGLNLDQYTITLICTSSGYESQTEFVTVLVEPIYTNLTLSENFVQVSQGDTFNITVDYIDDIGETRVPNSICTVTWAKSHLTSNTTDGFEIEFSTSGLDLGQYIITIKCNSSGYETKTAFVTVLVEPIPTSISVSDSIITVVQGDTFNITADYTENTGGLRVPNSDCDVTWGASTITSNTTDGFEIEFSTTGLELGQYIATILCHSSGYTPQSYFITVLIEPITTTISTSNVTVTTYSARTFNITVDYEEEISGNPVMGADIEITWSGTYSYSTTATGFEITFNTTGMSVGQYSASIQVNCSGWESQTTFIIIQINDLPSNLVLTSETPVEFYKGDQGIISVNFTVDGAVFPTGMIQIIGDIEGTLLWNGSEYVFEFDSSNLDPQIYFCRIVAQSTGVQTSELEIFINIKPVVLDVSYSSTYINFEKSGTNMLYISVYDVSHGYTVDNIEIVCSIDGISGTVTTLGNGNYSININQFGLSPSADPYTLEITIINPDGDNYLQEININYTRNLNLVWWITGAVAATVLLGFSTLLIYNRYIKQNRFQRDVAFIKKNITNLKKIQSRTANSREQMVSDIINKEIDQLL